MSHSSWVSASRWPSAHSNSKCTAAGTIFFRQQTAHNSSFSSTVYSHSCFTTEPLRLSLRARYKNYIYFSKKLRNGTQDTASPSYQQRTERQWGWSPGHEDHSVKVIALLSKLTCTGLTPVTSALRTGQTMLSLGQCLDSGIHTDPRR